MTQRPPIPTEIKRQVLVEAGHRCSIQTCRNTSNIDVHHIIPWSRCQEHKPENLIVLCPNCHRLAHDGSIDRTSLYKYKEISQNLINPSYPSGVQNDTIIALIKFNPLEPTEIVDSKNIMAFYDHSTFNFSVRFEEPFENHTYVVNAIGDGPVNFKVIEKAPGVIQIQLLEPCPNIVRFEFQY